MTKPFLLAIVCLGALPGLAQADDVLDAMEAAREAHSSGDMQDALDQLAFATQLIREKTTEGFVAVLPEAPAGWTQEIDTEMAAGLAMLGGGVGAGATDAGDGIRFKVTLMADTPMVTSLSGMIQSATLLGTKRNRVLIQAPGAAPDAMTPILAAIDASGLQGFDI